MSYLYKRLAALPLFTEIEVSFQPLLVTPDGPGLVDIDVLQTYFTASLETRVSALEAGGGAPSYWPTPRTISLSGPFMGSVTIDGSADAALAVTVPAGALSISHVDTLAPTLLSMDGQLSDHETRLAAVETAAGSDVATSAHKWTTARTLSLGGLAAGSILMDGSADVTLNVSALTVSKTDVGLANVDNTSDAAKPISTATQLALDDKAPLTGLGASGTWGISISGIAAKATTLETARNFSLTGVVSAIAVSFDGSGNLQLTTTMADGALSIAKTAGLQLALDSKLDASATAAAAVKFATARAFSLTGVISSAAGVNFDGTGNVNLVTTIADNALTIAKTSGLQGALDAKANAANAALTGTPTAPTALVGTNTTQIATTAFVQAEIANDAPSKTGTGASGTWGISISGSAASATTATSAASADTATKLTTPRAFSLNGVISAVGVNFDGTGNVVLNTAIADAALTIAKTSGLQAALDAKASTTGTLTFAGTIPDAANLDGYTAVGLYQQALNVQAANGTNYPVASAGQLRVFANGNMVWQEYLAYYTGSMYRRGYYGANGWSPWYELWDSRNFNPATKLDTTGTAASANKLATARTLTLSGDVSGSATFDGSSNVSINTTVSGGSHNHDSLYVKLPNTTPTIDPNTLGGTLSHGIVTATAGNGPSAYSTIWNFGATGNRDGQLGWYYGSGVPQVWFRSRHDTTGNWNSWVKLWHSGNFDPSGYSPTSHTHTAATTGAAGFMSATDKSKLDGIASGATTNSTDATLLNRANHTGSQAISTVTGLQTALDGKSATSHNHSGLYAEIGNAPRFSGAYIGADTDIYLYESAAGSLGIRTGSSASYKYFTFEAGGNFSVGSGSISTAGALEAARIYAGWDSGMGGSISCSNWFRTNGSTGLYFATHGVGVYATDGTYVRSYNAPGGFAAPDFVISSDRSLKIGIRSFEYRGRLRPVNYLHKATHKADFGFIAQEVQELYPEAVTSASDNLLHLSYPKLTAVLSYQVNRLEDEVAELRTQLQQLLAARKPWWKRLFNL